MSSPFFWSITVAFVFSLISLIGVASLSLKEEKLKKIIFLLVSFSCGTLLGGAFLHLLPEVLASKNFSTEKIGVFIILGILFFFILEKIICWRHCHIPTNQNHPHPLALMNIAGDLLHNFLDGIAVSASFLIDFQLGITTSFAIALHEIPQEIGDFSILIHAGYSRKKAIIANLLSSFSSFLGIGFVYFLREKIETAESLIVALTIGGFIYIATSDLLPELKKDNNKISKIILQLLAISLGILLMFIIKKIFDH